MPLQEQCVVALQAGAQDSQSASPRISPNAGPRNSYTVALTSLVPFARERRFRSAAVIARTPINHTRPNRSPHIIDNAERPFLVPKTGRGPQLHLARGPHFMVIGGRG